MEERLKRFECEIGKGNCGGADANEHAIGEAEAPLLSEPAAVVHYFTDPICSACWALEPVLGKLREEYGHLFQLRCYMGGLLKSWEGFTDSSNGISGPADVARHWDEVGRYSGMPIDGRVWINDPLESSYPPSIAYKAAQLQGERLSGLYLRRIREMVFVEGKNICREVHLRQAAADAGLDEEQFAAQLHNPLSRLAFEEDMLIARQSGIRSFPTLIVSNKAGKGVVVRGATTYQTYVSALEQALQTVPEPRAIAYSIEQLVRKYRFASTAEIASVLGLTADEALSGLEALHAENKVRKLEIPSGCYWQAA